MMLSHPAPQNGWAALPLNDSKTMAAGRPGLHTNTIERRQSRTRQSEVRVRSVIGFDRERGRFSRKLSEQCRQALRNGAESLSAAGLSMQDVVRVTYLVRDADAFPACFPLLRDAFGSARPAATLRLVSGFDVADVQIELELLARRAPAAA
jgi:enamine deaminase RidA (YjgF/YER057c/UK114 family)